MFRFTGSEVVIVSLKQRLYHHMEGRPKETGMMMHALGERGREVKGEVCRVVQQQPAVRCPPAAARCAHKGMRLHCDIHTYRNLLALHQCRRHGPLIRCAPVLSYSHGPIFIPRGIVLSVQFMQICMTA